MAVIFVNLNIDSDPMRYLIILFAVAISFFSCVKQKPKNPFPEIEFKEFMAPQNSRDTGAKILIGYSDGDGDLFVDQLHRFRAAPQRAEVAAALEFGIECFHFRLQHGGSRDIGENGLQMLDVDRLDQVVGGAQA